MTDFIKLPEGVQLTAPVPPSAAHILTAEAEERIQRHRRADLTTIPVGQVVGAMDSVRPAAEILQALVTDCARTIARMGRLAPHANEEQA